MTDPILPPASPFPRLTEIGKRLEANRDKAIDYQQMPQPMRDVTIHTMPAQEYLDTYRDIMFLLTALDAQGRTIGILGKVAARAAKVVERCDSDNLERLKKSLTEANEPQEQAAEGEARG